MSHTSEIKASGDEMIRLLGTRESGIMDYALGNKITVSWRGGDRYLCHTCVKNRCVHVDRVAKWRGENFS